ncbi:Calcium-transporting ATPase type 2C member 2 [Balamuthia mandrillaris]
MSVLCDFPPDARKMTTFHVSSSFSSSSSSQPIYFMKGALPVVLDHCTTISNAQGNIIDLTPQKQEMVLAAEKEMGENALRVVAFAYGTSPRSMNLAGLCGIMDPPRNGVLEAIREVQQTGVHVAMVTGDSRETAIAIARELSFFHRDSLALSSADLQRVSEEELASQIERVAVFYRMSPEDKMKIVKAYKNRGHIVAVTGDGVNDAPALKIADIGIAMGKGTDVCREAAEMILVDDNFATIVAAIEEGKSIYNNIKNFLRFQLTTSIATLSIIASSTLFGLPLPMNPIQILWINIIMDGPPAQSLGVEPLDKDAMKQPPRDTKQPVLSKPLLFSTLACALLMLFGTLGIYQSYLADPSYDIGEGDEEAAAQRTLKASTMAFNTFVFFQMFNAVNCRSDHKSAFQIKFMNNKFFLLAIGGSLLLQLAAIYVPILQMLFETTSLSLHELLQCLMVSSSVFGLDEARKYFLKAQQEGAVRFNV